MKRWLRRLAFVVALAAALAALRLTVLRPDPVPVTVVQAARGRVDETVTNSKAGSVRTRHRATLSAEIGGRVTSLPARKGDRVRKGDILLRLASADLEAQFALREQSLHAARAAENAACLAADQAKRVFERYDRLGRDRIVSPDQLDNAQSQQDVTAAQCVEAKARVREAGSARDAARVELDRTVLRAPFDGVVAELATEVGEWITPSPPGVPIPPVIDLIDPDAIYVSAPLDEVDVGRVRVGLPVRITMDSHPGASYHGTLTRVAPYVQDVEEQNRTFEVEVEFDDTALARTLLPGTSADVEVILESREDVLRIPSYALIEGRRVLVVRDDRLVSVPVEAGLQNWEYTEIVSGLEPGDPVVVSLDRAEVREGARVRAAQEPVP